MPPLKVTSCSVVNWTNLSGSMPKPGASCPDALFEISFRATGPDSAQALNSFL